MCVCMYVCVREYVHEYEFECLNARTIIQMCTLQQIEKHKSLDKQ